MDKILKKNDHNQFGPIFRTCDTNHKVKSQYKKQT